MLKLYLEIDERRVVKIMGSRNIIPLDEAENALKNYPSSSHWLSRVYSAQKSFDLSLSLLQQFFLFFIFISLFYLFVNLLFNL